MDGTGSKSSPASGDNVAAYTIAKLADGNCWMIKDLAISLYTGSVSIPTPTPIEVVINETGAAKDTKWTPTSGGKGSNYPLNQNTVCSNSEENKFCWYSLYAAAAGSGSNDIAEGEAIYSICPIGWRLPSNYTVSQTKSYGALTNAYGLTVNGDNNDASNLSTLQSAPMLFPIQAGEYSGGSFKYSGAGTRYWSSTLGYNSGRAYNFYYNTAHTAPQANSFRDEGHPVRCVAV